jgi:putative autoinducer-2 (AI-2) aldolase
MPEADIRDDKQFSREIPPPERGVFLNGSGGCDREMRSLAWIIRPGTGRATTLAIDHGSFQGPTTGLEGST